MNLLSPLGKPIEKPWKIHASLCIHRVIDSGALDSMIQLLCWKNPKVTFSRTTGDAMIDRARSQEASLFYRGTDADILLFLDDDIHYRPDEIVRMCHEAYLRQAIVCGPYVNKREEYTWLTSKPLDGEIIFRENGEVVEIKWGATGCMAIPRKVLTDIKENYEWWYQGEKMTGLPLCHPTDLKFYPFFEPMKWKHPNGDFLYLSEDWSFCERARSLGHKIYLDTGVMLGHAGRYMYDLRDLCREPKPDAKIIKYVDPSSKETSKDFGRNEKISVA